MKSVPSWRHLCFGSPPRPSCCWYRNYIQSYQHTRCLTVQSWWIHFTILSSFYATSIDCRYCLETTSIVRMRGSHTLF
jgi:hypothetical protein